MITRNNREQLPTIEQTLASLFMRVLLIAIVVPPILGQFLTEDLMSRVEQARYWDVPSEMVNRLAAKESTPQELLATLQDLTRQLRLFAPLARVGLVSPDGTVTDSDGTILPRKLSSLIQEQAPFVSLQSPELPVRCTDPYGAGSTLCLIRPIPGDPLHRSLIVTLSPVLLSLLSEPTGRRMLVAILFVGALSTLMLVGGARVVLLGGFRRQYRAMLDAIARFRPGQPLPSAPLSKFDELSTVDEEAHRLLEVLEETRSADVQRERGRREFFANTVHDLRGPVTSARGLLEVALDNAQPLSDLVPSLERCHSSQRKLTNALAALAAPVLDQAEAVVERVVLSELLRDIAEKVGPRVRASGIELSLVVNPPNLIAEIDPALMERAVENLINNAIRYTPADGRIAISAEQVSREVIIRVSDTGSGIAGDDLPFIFERMYRVQAQPLNDSEGFGAGLGLAIVQRIAAMHGGAAKVKSEIGTGSTFTIAIPVREISSEAKKSVRRSGGLSQRRFFFRSAELCAVTLRNTVVALPLLMVVAIISNASSHPLAWMLSACLITVMLVLPTWTEPSYEDGPVPTLALAALGIFFGCIYRYFVPGNPTAFGMWASVIVGAITGLALGRVARTLVPWVFIVPMMVGVIGQSMLPESRPELRLLLFGCAMLTTASRQLISRVRTSRFHRRTLTYIGLGLMIVAGNQVFSIILLTTKLIDDANAAAIPKFSEQILSELTRDPAMLIPSIEPSPDPARLADIARLTLLDPGTEVLIALPYEVTSGDQSLVYTLGAFFSNRVIPSNGGYWGSKAMRSIRTPIPALSFPLLPGSRFWRMPAAPHGRLVYDYLRKLSEEVLLRGYFLILLGLTLPTLFIGLVPLKRVARASDALIQFVRSGPQDRSAELDAIDVSEFRTIAETLHSLRSKVEEQRRSLNERDAEKQRLVADLASIVTSQVDRSDALLQTLKTTIPYDSRIVKRLHDAALEQQRFLDNIFDFARLDGRRVEKVSPGVDLAEALYEAVLTAVSEDKRTLEGSDDAIKRGVERYDGPAVHFVCDEEYRVEVSADLLNRTAINIISFVRKINVGRDSVELRLEQQGELVRLVAIPRGLNSVELDAGLGAEAEIDDPAVRLAYRLLQLRVEAMGGHAAFRGTARYRELSVTLPLSSSGGMQNRRGGEIAHVS